MHSHTKKYKTQPTFSYCYSCFASCSVSAYQQLRFENKLFWKLTLSVLQSHCFCPGKLGSLGSAAPSLLFLENAWKRAPLFHKNLVLLQDKLWALKPLLAPGLGCFSPWRGKVLFKTSTWKITRRHISKWGYIMKVHEASSFCWFHLLSSLMLFLLSYLLFIVVASNVHWLLLVFFVLLVRSVLAFPNVDHMPTFIDCLVCSSQCMWVHVSCLYHDRSSCCWCACSCWLFLLFLCLPSYCSHLRCLMAFLPMVPLFFVLFFPGRTLLRVPSLLGLHMCLHRCCQATQWYHLHKKNYRKKNLHLLFNFM